MKQYYLKLPLLITIIGMTMIFSSFSNHQSWSNLSNTSVNSHKDKQEKLFNIVKEENPEIAAYYNRLDSLKEAFKAFHVDISTNMMFIEETFVHLEDLYGQDQKHGKYIRDHRKDFLVYSNQLINRYTSYSVGADMIEEYQKQSKLISIIPMLDRETERIKAKEIKMEELLIQSYDFEKEGSNILEQYLDNN